MSCPSYLGRSRNFVERTRSADPLGGDLTHHLSFIQSTAASTSSNPYTQPTARYFSILSQANTPISSPQRRPSSSSRRGGPSRFRPSSPTSSDSAFVDDLDDDPQPPTTTTWKKGKRTSPTREPDVQEEELGSNAGAEGYYSRFFKEEGRLGMGAQGTVFLWSVRCINQGGCDRVLQLARLT